MPDEPNFGTLDVANFTVGAMLRAGIAVRRIVRGAESIEAAANCVIQYFYDHCVDSNTGERSCALVRFYKTHPYGALEPEQQLFAERLLGEQSTDDNMRCLALLATAGDEPEWNSRRESTSHQAIPLPSADIVRRAPMIARLIEELGLDIEAVVRGESIPARIGEARTYDVFHVEEAIGSPHIPAQREFVLRYGIESVVGFGGLLRSGELYTVILFSRVRIPKASAARFRAIALDVRSALYALDEAKTWAAH
ncbi:MAG: hypothetical protein ABIT20_11135 [Gemmatimonadaceae bacterium]